MERIWYSKRILATKINYISNIIVYYGYIHEWAELYRQLCRESREEWDKNANIIVKVIMKHKSLRCKMEFKNEFSNKQAKYLLKNNTYNYYRVGVWLYNSQSLKSFTKFIKNLDQYSTDLFYSVSVNYMATNHILIQNFLEAYFDKKFEGEAIEISNWESILIDILFLNNLDCDKFASDKLVWKYWNVVSWIPQNKYCRIRRFIPERNYNWDKLKELNSYYIIKIRTQMKTEHF